MERFRGGTGRNLRTMLIVLGFFLLVLGATAVEIALKSHQQRPLLGNVVALAILNINVLLLALLILLLGRQFVKLYFERKRSPFGAGFRSKLITAFVGLSIVPAVLLFAIAGGMLSGGVKYWFGPGVEGTMRDSIALVKSYKEDRKSDALHYAKAVADRLEAAPTARAFRKAARDAYTEYGLDTLEVYDRNGRLAYSFGTAKYPWAKPEKAFVSRALKSGEASSVATLKQGVVVRGTAPYGGTAARPAGVVVAGYVLSSVISNNISDITRFYDEYWSLRTFKNPLKESYMLSFILIALVIVFAALWSGLYLSKGITVPITSLAEATHRISRGEYDFKIDIEARDEIGVLVDSFKRMTEQLRVSHALLEQRRRFIETVLRNVNTGVLTIDRAGKISTVNRAAERIMAIDSREIMGKNYREVFEFHQLMEIREQIASMSETGSASVEREVQMTINRRPLTLRLFVSVLQDMDGGYMGILVVFDDLTELIKAQRAAAWKEVARRIAHEVKNPLTPIQLSAQRLRKRYLEGTGDYGPIINECTETIITQVEEMKNLVDEFSKFARMPEASPAPNDLHGIIDEVAALYLGAHKDIAIEREYDRAMPILRVDREQIKRVFMNLFDNAVTAMEGKGNIYVKTAHDGEAGMAKVVVSDDGAGILPEDRERLFQPYFSRKKSGTGLGLAIVSRIVSDHGGYIRVEDNAPKGASFVIELPVRG